MKKNLILAVMLTVLPLALLGAVTSTWYNGLGTWVHYDEETGETILVESPVWFADDFLGKAINTTNDWNFSGDNSGAAAVTAGAGGILRLTTGGTDDNANELAGRLVYQANKCAGIEVRLAVNDVAHTAVCLGFSDATSETSTLAVQYNTATVVTAADFVGFVWDSDETTTLLHGIGVKASTASALNFTTALVNGAYHILAVMFSDATGQADFYIDGTCVGGIATATTVTTPLCPYIGIINHEGAVNTLDIDYVKAWEGR